MNREKNWEKESESNSICSNDFKNIFIFQFQFYFLRTNNQYILKKPKCLRTCIVF
jgi:hypothetical protein